MGLLWIFGGFAVDFCGFTVGMGFGGSCSGSRCGCRWLCCCEWWLVVVAGGCGRVGVDSKIIIIIIIKIIHENNTLNNVKNYQTNFLFSNLL